MNILEYTLGLPPYRRGGLPKYSLDLARQLSTNNNVYLMYPGAMSFWKKKLGFRFKKSNEKFQIIELLDPLPVSLGLGISDEALYMEARDVTKITRLLTDLKIDVVHFHTFMGVPLELLQAIKQLKIKMVYTTHDFYGLCPKMLATDPLSALLETKCSADCMLCKAGPDKLKLWVMQSHLYATLKETKAIKRLRSREKSTLSADLTNEKLSLARAKKRVALRKYYLEMFSYIDEFHFNSQVARDYVKRFLPQAQGRVLNITHSGVTDERDNKDLRKQSEQISFGYIGPYDAKKGFFMLKDTLERLRLGHTNFEISFCGDVAQDPFFENEWVHNYGILSQTELDKFYSQIDVLLMPSLWHETFGFVALEGISRGIPVLVSDHVGAKDLLSQEFIFTADEASLEEKLAVLCTEPELLDDLRQKLKQFEIPTSFSKHVAQLVAEFYH